jgi:hypothetical protein
MNDDNPYLEKSKSGEDASIPLLDEDHDDNAPCQTFKPLGTSLDRVVENTEVHDIESIGDSESCESCNVDTFDIPSVDGSFWSRGHENEHAQSVRRYSVNLSSLEGTRHVGMLDNLGTNRSGNRIGLSRYG